MNSTDLILADKPTLPVFQIAPGALALRDNALAGAALIGKVENAAQNEQAVKAHIALKAIASSFEKARKTLKEPLLEAGRQLDRCVAKELADVEKEIGRIATLSAGFQLAEQNRIREEQELQRRELERIEREKQAEIARVAREAAEAERKAREATEAKAREEREAAAKLAREATNKKQREAAEAARVEAEKRAELAKIEAARLAEENAAKAAAEMARIQESADAARLAEAKPIESTRTFGQVVKTDWEITVVNPYELAKFHPDCVKIEPLLTPIKQALNMGIAVKGIRAEKKITAGVRLATAAAIEV